MVLTLTERKFSKSRIGYLLLATYCLAVLSFFLAGAGAVWLRAWGPAKFRLFSIPAASMSPTLNKGDLIIGAIYAWQKPQPRHGDLIFFYRDGSRSNVWIKRIIALPGDRVQMIGGQLYINDIPVPREQIERYPTQDDYGRLAQAPQYEEILPHGARYRIIETKGNRGYYDDTAAVQVPEGKVFVMGDHRDKSSDSRDPSMGAVAIDSIIGHPILIIGSKSLSRIGTVPR